MLEQMKKDAKFSEDRRYRYVLSRIWDDSLPKIMFIGLNPSTADENEDDSTINKCINYAKKWNYGGIYMLNLFAFVDTYQNELYYEKDPIGELNNKYLKEYAGLSEKIVVAWGNNGAYKGRSKEVYDMFNHLYCLKINKTGEPHHPLYISSNIELQEYKRRA